MKLNREQIKKIIPHREPFLLLDEVFDLEPGQKGRGKFLVESGQIWLQGHFPNYPLLPGVLLIESLAQLGAVVVLAENESSDRLPLFAGMEEVKFRRQVRPGDLVHLEIEIIRARSNFGLGQGRALVEGELAGEGRLKFAFLAGGDSD